MAQTLLPAMLPRPRAARRQRRSAGNAQRWRGRAARALLALLSAAAAGVFFSTIAYYVWRFDFRPLAAFCLPVAVVFFAFTSLLYMRGRSLSPGRDQFRTLFAAERSMRATLCYLTGIAVGASLYGLLRAAGFVFDPATPTASGLWLLLFLLPSALMVAGLLLFIGAAALVWPQFLPTRSVFAVARRIGRGD